MHIRSDPDGVNTQTLVDNLIDYPVGTSGHYEMIHLLTRLNELCKRHGYGAVPQYAKWIEEVWRDPAKVKELNEFMTERREAMVSLSARKKP